MTSESLSLPISPASGCCSENSQGDKDLPVTSANDEAKSSCEAPKLTAPAVDPVTPASLHQHGDSCSHHQTPQVNETPAPVSDGPSKETSHAPDGNPSNWESPDWQAPDDAALIDALRQVIDPELMINIVDLGLVYSINQTDRKVLVEMTLTSPACPAGPQIISQAKMSLEKLSGVETAEIKLTMSPPWTPDRMTDDARDQLGIF